LQKSVLSFNIDGEEDEDEEEAPPIKLKKRLGKYPT
jgi:hypothetical protein